MDTPDQVPSAKPYSSNGAFIAFMGLPGSGKTTIARALASYLSDAVVFCEPDECDWPDAVTGRHNYGYFTAITCFRAMRVPQLFMAADIRAKGSIAIVDSYYDKLLSRYIYHELMTWLIPRSDPYFDAMERVSKLDWTHLPNADHLVFLKLTEAQWKSLLHCRNRNLDQEAGLLNSYRTQEAFLEAAREIAQEGNTALHVVDQIIGNQDIVARNVLASIGIVGTRGSTTHG